MYKKLQFLIFLICCVFSLDVSSKDKLYSFKLKNGMQVLLVPDYNSELVMHSVFYKVGGLQDFHGKAGLAHFLEHLMFRSTKNYKSGELVDFFDKNGALYNAATGEELTFYYELSRKEILEDLMLFESDRMKNLILKDDEIDKEREIVKEERRMRTDNIPEEKFLEKLLSIFYNNDYYGQSLIGTMNDINSISNQDFRNFYHKYYNPNNAILVIVGNFDVDKTKDLVEKYYGELKNDDAELKEHYYRNPNPDLPLKTKNLFYQESDQEVKQSSYYYLTMAPTFASKNEDDGLVMRLLANIIANGDNMLSKKLVEEKKIASSVQILYNNFSYDNAPFLIKIDPVDDSKIPEIEDFMKDFFKNQKEIVSEQELERFKNLQIDGQIYFMDDIQNKAMLYGEVLLFGLNPKVVNNYDKKIESIKVSDIEAMYNRVFIENPYIVGILTRG